MSIPGGFSFKALTTCVTFKHAALVGSHVKLECVNIWKIHVTLFASCLERRKKICKYEKVQKHMIP